LTEAVQTLSDSAVSEVAQLPPLTEQESHRLIELVWRFFCSLRLTLANLLGLGLGMILGTFVNPSNDSLANIERAFAGRPFVLALYRTFELHDLFRSWWFTLFLTSLALNLTACSLERLPRIYFLVRYPTLRLDDVKGLRYRALPAATSLPLDAIRTLLEKAGYRVKSNPREGGGADLFCERGRYARFGVWVVHLSLLMVLGGGVVGRLSAFEGTTDIPGNGGESDSMIIRNPDGSMFRRRLGVTVKCDDFRLKEFSPGRPKAFESDLRVLSQEPGREGQVLAKKTITVNDPLKFGGLTFYQATYRPLDEGQRARVALFDKASKQERLLNVGAGEPIEAAEGLTYQLVDYQDDFVGMGPAVQVVRTEEPPGALVQKARSGRPIPSAAAKLTSFWVFAKRPEFDRDNREDRFSLRFERLAQLYATGLQVARDPSIPVVYTGCFLLFVGIGIAFYASHRRIWARLDGGQLALGGAAHRNQEVFGDEFQALCEKLGLQARKGGELMPPRDASEPA
jgi:cytochrome c biogenesis protein